MTAVQPAEPDLLLLQRFIETGDPASFAEIVQRYSRVVYSASLRILGDEAHAQDVSQETFYRLMQSPRVVTHSLAGWLHRTATHLALDMRRSEKSRKQREVLYTEQQLQARNAQPGWADVSPYVDQALNEIPEPTRGLLIRHFLQGVQQAELAVEQDVSPATISRRIKTGLEQLQDMLRKKGVYLSIGLLAGLCAAHSTDAAVPPALVLEMGKMNLIASLRQLPAGPVPPTGPFHTPYQMTCKSQFFIADKFTAAIVCVSVVLGAYLFAVTAAWIRANPSASSSPPSIEHVEPVELHHDR